MNYVTTQKKEEFSSATPRQHFFPFFNAGKEKFKCKFEQRCWWYLPINWVEELGVKGNELKALEDGGQVSC